MSDALTGALEYFMRIMESQLKTWAEGGEDPDPKMMAIYRQFIKDQGVGFRDNEKGQEAIHSILEDFPFTAEEEQEGAFRHH